MDLKNPTTGFTVQFSSDFCVRGACYFFIRKHQERTDKMKRFSRTIHYDSTVDTEVFVWGDTRPYMSARL